MGRAPEKVTGEDASGLTGLAQALGFSGDLGDEHARWALYQEALRQGALDLLLLAVAEDPDHMMASGAVVGALEQVHPGERGRWVSVTTDWSTADFVARRAGELDVLESVSRTVGGDDPPRPSRRTSTTGPTGCSVARRSRRPVPRFSRCSPSEVERAGFGTRRPRR